MSSGMKGVDSSYQHPKAEGYGQKAGVGKDKDYTKSEQDGENRLLRESDFMNRDRLAGNE